MGFRHPRIDSGGKMTGSEQQGLWSGVLGHWRQAQLCLSSVNWEAIGQPRPRALKIFSHLTQQCRFEESIPGKHFGMQAELSASLLCNTTNQTNKAYMRGISIHTLVSPVKEDMQPLKMVFTKGVW